MVLEIFELAAAAKTKGVDLEPGEITKYLQLERSSSSIIIWDQWLLLPYFDFSTQKQFFFANGSLFACEYHALDVFLTLLVFSDLPFGMPFIP